MVKACNVCDNPKMNLVYESPDNLSVTTMNKLLPGKTSVYFCESCGHLQTNELDNLRHYYAEEYEVNLASDDVDQLYSIINGRPVYRAAHQANILMKKVSFENGWRVLDYGCAKSQTLKKVLGQNADINPFMFDVTDKYVPYWQKFPKAAEWSTHIPNPAWYGTMDVVLSFYALEHVADLHEAIDNIKKLLKLGGIFYFLVPNVYENAADIIVADHINHFSRSSLNALLSRNGFKDIDIDAASHEAAFVVCATLAQDNDCDSVGSVGIDATEIRNSKDAVMKMAGYWSDVVGRIQAFEESIDEGAFAIYGAGFYGNFIASAMKQPEKIICFVDQNQHLQYTNIRNLPVLFPDDIPAEVQHVLVGMNPQRARDNIAQIESWKSRNLNYFFL
jgi:SAM-dependent methyltransferase